MAIQSKRFEFLDRETQVGSANFSKLLGSSVQNIQQNAFTEIQSSLSSLLKTSIQVPSLPMTDLLSTFKDIERVGRDTLGSVIDFSKLPTEQMSQFTSVLSSGKLDTSRSLEALFSKCSSGSMGMGYGGRSYAPSITCSNGKIGVGYGGSSYGCDASSYGDLLSKLGADSTLRTFQDIAKAMAGLLSLSKRGYSLGICGVFGSLISSANFTSMGLGSTEFSKASGILLSTLGLSSNTRGWLDVAASTVTNDLTPLRTNPGAVSDLFNHYKIPTGYSDSMLKSLSTQTFEVVENIDPSWITSREDGILSVASYTPSDDLGTIASVKLKDRSFTENTLDVIPDLGLDFSLAALSAL